MSKNPKNINQGLFGINLEGLFKPSSLPNDAAGSSEYGYDWLSELNPTVLRFPSGESAKLMHLLHNTDGTDAVGYGYDMYEIARYFNWTDGVMNSIDDDDIFYENPDDDIENATLGAWMDIERVADYKKFRDKYLTQLCETRRYIDDFIYLVNKINTDNAGRPPVKVLLSLNIISETATECKAIADYLRAHGVNVVGVEIGNEVYAEFYCQTMGFRYAKKHHYCLTDGDPYNDDEDNEDNWPGNYWDYINGSNYDEDEGEPCYNSSANLTLETVLTTEMLNDHDFIGAFKNVSGYNYKVGLVGRPLGNPYAFRIDEESGLHSGCDPNDMWNNDLNDLYGEMRGSDYAFDAVILHNYYSADSWMDIPLDPTNLVLNTSCSGASELWDFDASDPRLENAFKKIKGVGGEYGNFRDFIINHEVPGDYVYSIQASFLEFNEQLEFDLPATNPLKKELWVTEWNLKDVLPDNDGGDEDELDQKKILIYDNTFMQGALLMQWWLKDIKLNFESTYRQNFFTYSTIQGYAGGVWTDLLTLSDHQERVEQGANVCPWEETDCSLMPSDCDDENNHDTPEFNSRNYWMRRTMYFTARLYSDIHRYGLKYLPCNFSYSGHNLNIEPTVFIDENVNPEYAYFYVTNTKASEQNYSVDPTLLRLLFTPVPDHVELGTPTYSYIDAKQLYSTSGNAKLYQTELNACYNTYDHPTDELQSITWNETITPGCPTGVDYCLTANPYSIGYFKVPIIPVYLRESEPTINLNSEVIDVYPNPTSDAFYFSTDIEGNQSEYQVRVFNQQGLLVFETNSVPLNEININNLSAGCYVISIINGNGVRFNSQLVKLQ